MAAPAFKNTGTLTYIGGDEASSGSTTITSIASGDLVLVFVQRNNMNNLTSITGASGALTFTRIKSAQSGSNNFWSEIWAALAPQAYASLTITASFSDEQLWLSIYSAAYSGVANITPLASSFHDADGVGLMAASTDRIALSISPAKKALLIACGTDWNYYRTFTGQNSFAKRVDSQSPYGANSTTMFLLDRAADAGTYGGSGSSGRFATTNLSDQYMSMLVAFEATDQGATTTAPPPQLFKPNFAAQLVR